MRRAGLLSATAIAVACLAGCRTGARLTDDGAPPVADQPRGPVTQPAANRMAAPGTVTLAPTDLAPVDAWISAKTNPQWILGDEVEVVASREFFATALTINAPTSGIVERHDDVLPTETVVTLRFRGAKSQAGVMTSPRVQIGTGLTVTARRLLRVRLQKTSDPGTPVHLRIDAQGDAVRGVRESVVERAAAITIGGTLRRRGGGYAWDLIRR